MAQATTVFAHEGSPPEPHDFWTTWSLEPLVLIGLAISAWLYWRCARRMTGRGLRGHEPLAFLGGWLASVIALVSPLDGLGAALFSAHMTQSVIVIEDGKITIAAS